MNLQDLPNFWPNREYSQFIKVDGIDWHVQTRGTGPALLMIHGTGASSHSWAALAEKLADRFTLVMPDLPGQGFSSALPDEEVCISGFADRLQGLLSALDIRPKLLVGHSAGAVIATHLALHEQFSPAAIIALNGAFLPFGSAAAPVFNRLAHWLSKSRLLAYITAAHGMFNRPIRNMLVETGSNPSAQMMECYRELISRPDHVTGTLKMMAGWDLADQRQALPSLRTPLHLIVCTNDRTVSPWQSERLSEFVSCSKLYRVPDLGHLGHEEDPAPFADIIQATLSTKI
ncbi:MAG: alpha/beta fold hydrolase [Luminiphilus sp.]|nr:alpha/beta fold hydrolase [Luminiphilus sp.]